MGAPVLAPTPNVTDAPLAPVARASVSSAPPPVDDAKLRSHILDQIGEVRKAVSMELITQKAAAQIISVLMKALPIGEARAAAATPPTTAIAPTAAALGSSVKQSDI